MFHSSNAKIILPALAASAILVTSLLAQVPGIPPHEQPGTPIAPIMPATDLTPFAGAVDSDEQLFINEAGSFSALEYQMGEVALTHSNNVSVQAYARRVMNDHARLREELAGLARQVHAAAPGESSQTQMLDALAALQGIEFDRAYMSATVSNHEAAVASFQNESIAQPPRGISLAPLTDWAKRSLPLLNDELTAGQALAESVGGLRHNGGQVPPK